MGNWCSTNPIVSQRDDSSKNSLVPGRFFEEAIARRTYCAISKLLQKREEGKPMKIEDKMRVCVDLTLGRRHALNKTPLRI